MTKEIAPSKRFLRYISKGALFIGTAFLLYIFAAISILLSPTKAPIAIIIFLLVVGLIVAAYKGGSLFSWTLYWVALFLWSHVLIDGLLSNYVWLPIINWMTNHGWSQHSKMLLLGSQIIFLEVLSMGSLLAYATVCFTPFIRKRCYPLLLAHISAFFIFWIAFGTTKKVLFEHFPYLNIPHFPQVIPSEVKSA